MDNLQEGHRIEQKTDRVLVDEQFRWAGGKTGQRVLDLGCAVGTCCRLFADCVGSHGRVIGVDASIERITAAPAYAAQSANIEYIVGQAASIPLDENAIDFAWSRFLFEYLPDPVQALHEMIRVTKPGGIVCVSDLDGNGVWHSPEPPELRQELEAVMATFGGGFDPYVGRKIYPWFVAADLDDLAIDIRPYHTIAGSIGSLQLEHWDMKMFGVTRALVKRGWTSRRAEAFADLFREFLLDPGTLTYSTLITVRGTKRR